MSKFPDLASIKEALNDPERAKSLIKALMPELPRLMMPRGVFSSGQETQDLFSGERIRLDQRPHRTEPGEVSDRYPVTYYEMRKVCIPAAAPVRTKDDLLDKQRIDHYIREVFGVPHPQPPKGVETPIDDQQTLITPQR